MKRPSIASRSDRYAHAFLLLLEGYSYRLAAKIARCSRTALAKAFPGLGLTQADGGQMTAALVRARRAGVAL